MPTDLPDAAPSLLDIYLALSHIGPATGALAPLLGEAPEETPRLHIAHTAADEWRVFMRPDLPAEARARLAALPPGALFADAARVADALGERADLAALNIWQGRTLLFPADLDAFVAQLAARDDLARLAPTQANGADDWYGAPAPSRARRRPAIAPVDEAPPAREVFPREQFSALADGLVVATCQSARESALAAEAWVRTLPAARGQGHATRVTALWAFDALRRGKTPFYSHHRANLASAGVARALQLIPFLEDVGYL
jgi:hypothetical protein